MTLPTNRTRPMFAALCASLVFSTGFSQVNSPSTDDPGDRDVFELDAFSVTSEKERGYGASIAPTASRLNIPIEDLPININVISHDFLEEINESDTQNVLSWNASVSGGRNLQLRGFSGNSYFTDGFTSTNFWYPPAYVDRVEIIKGPASMWVARTSPGGTVNYIRAKAMPYVDVNEIKFGWGDVNGQPRYHATIDANKAIGENMAVRFIADYAFREDNTMPGGIHTASDHSGTRAGMSAISTFNRFNNDKTELRVGLMRYRANIKSQDGRHTARGASLVFNEGDAVPSSVAVPVEAGSQIPVNVAYPNDIDQFDDFGWGRNFPINLVEYYAEIKHRFSQNVTGVFKGNWHTRNMGHDPANGVSAFYPEFLRDGTPNDGPDPEPAVRESWFANTWWFEAPDVQAYVQWEPQFENSRQIFTAGASWSSLLLRANNFRLVHPGTNDQYSRYWFFRTEEHSRRPPNIGEYNKLLDNEWVTEEQYTTLNLNYFGQFAEGRASIMAGLSINEIENIRTSHNNIFSHPTEVGEPTRLVERVRNPDDITENSSTNPMFGGLWELNDKMSIFGQYSTSLAPTRSRDGFGNPLDPVFSKGIETGIKFHGQDDKIRGSLVYYNIEEDDRIVFDPDATNLEYEASVAAGSPNPGLLGANVQAGSITADGLELDLQLNLNENWFANISLAKNFDRQTTAHPNASLVGLTENGFVPYALAFYNKYRFTSGNLEGLQIGGGIIHRGDQERRRGSLEYEDEGYTTFDLHAQYHQKLSEKFSSVIQLTLRNITEEDNSFNGWDAVNNRKFALKNPMVVWVDYKLKF